MATFGVSKPFPVSLGYQFYLSSEKDHTRAILISVDRFKRNRTEGLPGERDRSDDVTWDLLLCFRHGCFRLVTRTKEFNRQKALPNPAALQSTMNSRLFRLRFLIHFPGCWICSEAVVHLNVKEE